MATRAPRAAAKPATPTYAAPSSLPPSPWLHTQLTGLLAQRGHAWLLQGPSGLGQYELGLMLAQAWLCDAPQAQGVACGQCESCHAVAVRTHADLLVVMPEVQMQALGWPLPEKAQAELDEKKRKPSKEIRVEALRQVVEFAQRTSARGRGKAVLVYPAERMNAISANALLKTLEEPAGDLRFVLASEAAHLLLPTIRSRCITHALAWPDAQAAIGWLAQCGVSGDEAQALLAMAGGRPTDALALASSGLTAADWVALPKALAQGEPAWLKDQPPPQAVAHLQKLCHDLMALGCGAQPRYFPAATLQALFTDAGKGAGRTGRGRPWPDGRSLVRWSQSLLTAARTAEHPFQAGLMTEFLVSEASQAINSGFRTPPA
ncbi:DNA polymerase III subunit delta' [Comamonas serinivorans]|uniref:DNA polymerase III subunit delta n=1 Tax=Comamonas serinivorans TaxID=1082851 RepID=A0A1Y0EP80_9BURK|nr:DNA polymerase III subunit delta' [Comamonas serinivorans]ARU05454.1 DNA polymerase III subunit delta' [Comamonas serinivorans]